MNILNEVYLNKLARKLIPIEEGIKWFSSKNEDEKKSILQMLMFYILQGGGHGEDVESAIELSSLKRTYTPLQLLLKAKEDPLSSNFLKVILRRIIGLQYFEREKSFVLLINMLHVVFNKEELTENDKKNKWWVNDLSDESFVDEVIRAKNHQGDE